MDLDVSIARGLDYYTGTIYETFLTDDLGHRRVLLKGGRYDNLAGLFTNQKLPGVSASLGVDRLLAAAPRIWGRVVVPHQRRPPCWSCCSMSSIWETTCASAASCGAAGINAEVFPDAKKVLASKLQYADRKGFRLALIAGGDEFPNRASGRSKTSQVRASRRPSRKRRLVDEVRKSCSDVPLRQPS